MRGRKLCSCHTACPPLAKHSRCGWSCLVKTEPLRRIFIIINRYTILSQFTMLGSAELCEFRSI
jgi:hypothetical protein